MNFTSLFLLLDKRGVFIDHANLDSFLHKNGAGTEENKCKKVGDALHNVLRPFLLRRVKTDMKKNLLPSTWCLIY